MPDFGSLGALIALGLLTEATVQIFFKDITPFNKMIYSENNEKNETTLRLLSAFIGVAYAFNMGIDIFILLGYQSKIPFIGTIATGLIASRGSNYLHDILGNIANRNRETIV